MGNEPLSLLNHEGQWISHKQCANIALDLCRWRSLRAQSIIHCTESESKNWRAFGIGIRDKSS